MLLRKKRFARTRMTNNRSKLYGPHSGVRRRGAAALEELVSKLQQDFSVTTESYGSFLKFFMIAEGRADLYPCFRYPFG